MLSNKPESSSSMPPGFHAGSDSIDGDHLARMGYKPELKRNLSIWSLLGLGFSVSNSWWGASASLAAGISSGGPMLMIYGIIFVSLIAACIGVSLAELASAMPNSGGQYYWAGQLAPRKHAAFLAFLTGGLNWAGAIFASSSVALSLATSFVGLYALGHPGFVSAPWMTFLAYQLINIFGMLFNCYHAILPSVSLCCLYISIFGWIISTIVVPAVSEIKQPASFVFATFINETGWTNNAIAFIVGLISPAWCFGALDVATHLAEEIHQPERMIPKSILCTVLVGLVSAVTYCVAMFFSLSDYTSVVNSPTGVPILELYYQSMKHRFAGAAVLQVLFILTGFGCFVACRE
ncbi:amino acid permease [Ceratobasidium sp. AG-Ba]|nr:amino acid permease [Ceratobasidium sp. AG-Ba]QRW09221.1 amino acid permease [Ceratobasidium sp. AG-Ba]